MATKKKAVATKVGSIKKTVKATQPAAKVGSIKKTVKATQPAAKTVTKREKAPPKSLALKSGKRIQTFAAWKRNKIQKRQTVKKSG